MTQEEITTLRAKNTDKFLELRTHVQWAAFAFQDSCFGRGFYFRVSEAYRTQERQNILYAQGRWMPGKKVTWTLTSNHTARFAIDVYPLNCKHDQIAPIAALFGITHPLKDDPPHYEFTDVGEMPVQVAPLHVQLSQKIRALKRSKGLRLKSLTRAIDRLKKMLGMI